MSTTATMRQPHAIDRCQPARPSGLCASCLRRLPAGSALTRARITMDASTVPPGRDGCPMWVDAGQGVA